MKLAPTLSAAALLGLLLAGVGARARAQAQAPAFAPDAVGVAGSETAQAPSTAPKPVKTLPAAKKGSADPAMAALEEQYAAERTADLLASLARYADELSALQKSLLTAGDTAGAARVQLELDRVLPVVGTVKAQEGGDDFSIFEETGDSTSNPAALAADAPTPADLESLLKALQAPASGVAPASSNSTESNKAGSGSGSGPGGASPPKSDAAPVKTARRLLKMASAQLNSSLFPEAPYLYWIAPGRRAVWTLSDLPAGPCRVVLRYACDDKAGGGKLAVRLGASKTEVDVPTTGSWTRYRDLPAGTLDNAEPRADLVLEVASLKDGATSLMDLKAVMVIPAEKP